jgi:hypothetical protein
MAKHPESVRMHEALHDATAVVAAQVLRMADNRAEG